MNIGTIRKLDDGRFALEILDYERSRLAFEPDADLAFVTRDGVSAGSGRVVACEPPALLEYTWDTETLRFELIEDGPAATVLVFTNIVDDHGTAVAVEPGWGTGLDRLGARLDGRHAHR